MSKLIKTEAGKQIEEILKQSGKPFALALLSLYPATSAFATFCNEFVNSKLQDRVEKWQEEVIKEFSKLDEKTETKIRESQNFASILATAQQNAIKDIEEDKVAFYVASVINAIKNENMDNVKIHMFLNALSEFTILHIKTLEYFKIQHKCLFKHSLNEFGITSSKDRLICHLKKDCPDIISNESLLKLVVVELYNSQMLKIQKLEDIIISSVIDKQTTYFGEEFLHFISTENK